MPAAASTSASSAEASARRVPVGAAISRDIVRVPKRLERRLFVSWPGMNRLPILLACLMLALVAVACGDDSEDQPPAPEETATAEPAAAPGSVDPSTISKDLSAKPQVTKPEGAPPTKLVKADIVKGKGPAAKAGDTVAVQYVGNSWSTGTQFDASWDRGGQPFEFPLGAGRRASLPHASRPPVDSFLTVGR